MNGSPNFQFSIFNFQISIGHWHSAGLALLLGSALHLAAQPKNPAPPPVPLAPAEGDKQARALVAGLLAQRPTQTSSNAAVVRIRDADGKRSELPVSFQIVPTATNYLTIYEASDPSGSSGKKLIIYHTDGQPNRYFESGPNKGDPKEITGAQLMAPFAGSDFWIADLGLEFLHWPQQRILRKEMRKGQSCAVLQSVNPNPAAGGYARVVSWIALNQPEDTVIVHANGFDVHDKPLKEFDPKKIEKVNGFWQLESMEMRNVQTDSRTVIEFQLSDHP